MPFHTKLLTPYLIQMVKRIAILILVYSILRFIFLLINYPSFGAIPFSDAAFVFILGIRFDISALLYINLLFIVFHLLPLKARNEKWYQTLLKTLFYIFNIPAIIVAMGDIGFFGYVQRRSTIDIGGYAGDFYNMLPRYLMDFWYLIVIFIFIVVLIEWLYRKTGLKQIEYKRMILKESIIFMISMGIVIIGMRGGLQLKPITPINAGDYTKPQYAALVSNTPFNMMYSLYHRKLQKVKYFEDNELNRYFEYCKQFDDKDRKTKSDSLDQPKNVMVILLESFSKDFYGIYGNQPSCTPFLDSLAGHSMVFNRFFSSGSRSVDGIAAVFASIPNMGNDFFINSIYIDNEIPGLGTLLKKQGYYTTFFHGADNQSFNFESFLSKAGFDRYFGRHEFNNDAYYDGSWGIYDGPFLQFVAHKMNDIPEPFCAGFFSLSSHHPYQLPDEFHFDNEDNFNKIEKSVRYTDHALQMFFKEIKQTAWYNNTLFVILADHKNISYRPNTDSDDRYAIPLIIFNPKMNRHQEFDFAAQQIDILPTVLDMLDYDLPFCSFGTSLTGENSPHIAFQYQVDRYELKNDDYTLHYMDKGKYFIYDHHKDPEYKKDIKDSIPSAIKTNMVQTLQAVIQTYNNAMIENKLTYRRRNME
jgi:phosphoglycerol transferase MdoB-like AlkP superfamily enzyme